MTLPKLQPSTVIGIGAGLGTIAGIVAHYLAGGTSLSLAVFGVVTAVAAIMLPDNTAAQNDIGAFFRDAVNAAVSKNPAAALPLLLGDGLAVARDLQTPAPAAAPTPSADPAPPAHAG